MPVNGLAQALDKNVATIVEQLLAAQAQREAERPPPRGRGSPRPGHPAQADRGEPAPPAACGA